MTSSELDVGMRCIKYMLFVTNFMFAMIGFLLISIGSTVNAIYSDFEHFMDSHYFSPSALFIAIGIIMFFVSLFGCIGAFKQSVVLVNIYGSLLFVILILEISAAIAAYVMRGDVDGFLTEKMEETIVKTDDSEIMEAWNFTQERLGCCGVRGWEDWKPKRLTFDEKLYEDIPESCFEGDEKVESALYKNGCLDRLHFVIVECAYLIGTGGICVAIVQVLGVIFASMLAKSIRRLKTESERERQEERQRMYAQLAQGPLDGKVVPVPVVYIAPEMNA